MASSATAGRESGTAGSVGALGVQKAAEQLERACRAREAAEVLTGKLRGVLAELAPVLLDLRSLAETERDTTLPANDAQSICQPQLLELGEQLKALLLEDNALAVNLWLTHKDRFRRAWPSAWKAIDIAIEGFEFQEALSLLGKAVNSQQN